MESWKRYKQAVGFLDSLLNLPENKGIYQAERMRWFLDFLKFPEKRLKIIHVAGTAGKGSTVHYLHEILQAAGKRVGSYYSPHPTTAIERIRVGKSYISPAEFADLVEELKSFLDKAAAISPFGRLTYFEVFLAIGLLYFIKKKCEYVIIETGIGGRRDATNAVKRPLICVLTNVDYDHTEILGRSLKKIAWEKIGILKKNAAFFTAERRPEILKIFWKEAVALNCRFDSIAGSNEELAAAVARFLKISEKKSPQDWLSGVLSAGSRRCRRNH